MELIIDDNKIDGSGGEYFIKITASGVWRIDKPTTDDWYELSSTVGKGNQTVVLKVLANDSSERIGN